MLVGLGGITRQISHHQPYLPSTSCFSLRPQFVRKTTAGSSSPSSSPSHHYQPSSPNNIPAGRGLLKLLSAKNIKSGSGSGQSSVFTVQPPEIWGRPDRIIIFIRVVFVDGNHPAIHNYPVVLFNKQKVHSSHLIGMNGLRQF